MSRKPQRITNPNTNQMASKASSDAPSDAAPFMNINITAIKTLLWFGAALFGAILGGALWLRSKHDSDVWVSSDCAFLSYALLSTAIFAFACVCFSVIVLLTLYRPHAPVFLCCGLFLSISCLAFSIGRILVAHVTWPELMHSFLESKAVVLSLSPCAAVIPETVSHIVQSSSILFFILAFCIGALAIFLGNAAIVWVTLHFYAAIYYFFPKQRVYLGMFAVMLVLVNIKTAFANALGEKPQSISSAYFEHLANADLSARAAAEATDDATNTQVSTPRDESKRRKKNK